MEQNDYSEEGEVDSFFRATTLDHVRGYSFPAGEAALSEMSTDRRTMSKSTLILHHKINLKVRCEIEATEQILKIR